MLSVAICSNEFGTQLTWLLFHLAGRAAHVSLLQKLRRLSCSSLQRRPSGIQASSAARCCPRASTRRPAERAPCRRRHGRPRWMRQCRPTCGAQWPWWTRQPLKPRMYPPRIRMPPSLRSRVLLGGLHSMQRLPERQQMCYYLSHWQSISISKYLHEWGDTSGLHSQTLLTQRKQQHQSLAGRSAGCSHL